MSESIQIANEEDLQRLRRLLRRVSSRDLEAVRRRLAASRAPVERAEARVLDLACGNCREAEVIADIAAEWKGSRRAAAKLTGIDVRAREIADAARQFGKRRPAGEQGGDREFEFLVGDATKLPEHRELGENFDLVFLRHQNYWDGERAWEEIFDHALSKLDSEGRLVITSYFDREHRLAVEAIERLGGELICSEANPESRALATPGKSVDRHVAIFRRKGG